MYLYIALAYFGNYADEPGSRVCIQSDLNWICAITYGAALSCMFLVCGMSMTEISYKSFILFVILNLLIIFVNFVMIYPTYNIFERNPYTQCWMPFTIPIIIFTTISLCTIVFLFLKNYQ